MSDPLRPGNAAADIDGFVRAAKERDVPDEALVALLRQNGWSDRRVYRSLGKYYGDLLGMPPPSRSGRREYARDAFYYLINFITLAMWTVALGQIFYKFVDHVFPDPGVDPYFGIRDVASQLATIIIAFPVFFGVNRLLAREMVRRPDHVDSAVRI